MPTLNTFDDVSHPFREAVIDLLYRLADDALILGYRHVEWTDPIPMSDDEATFSSMGRDELDHARAYFDMLHELGEPEPTKLISERTPRQLRCASLVTLPNDKSWSFCLTRQFFYDTAKVVRLAALAEGTLVPLARLASTLESDARRHLGRTRDWILRLAASDADHRLRLGEAIEATYGHALGLFEPTGADLLLAQAGICPHEGELCRHWESAMAPVLAGAGLEPPAAVRAVYGGRVGRHSVSLAELLNRHAVDP